MLDTLRQVFTDNWIAWAYQYAVGGVFFFATLAIAVRSGAVHPHSRRDRRLAAGLLAGYFLWAGAHAAWIARVQGPPGALTQVELDRREASRTPAVRPGGR